MYFCANKMTTATTAFRMIRIFSVNGIFKNGVLGNNPLKNQCCNSCMLRAQSFD